MPRYVEKVIVERPTEVKESDVLTLTEASELLGLSRPAVSDLVMRRALRHLVDTAEPNPTKANRVLRSDVERELARRRSRRSDARLRGRVGRGRRG